MIEFKLSKQDVFSTPIWEIPVLGLNTFSIYEYCLKVRKEKKGVTISNRGGWHSNELIQPYPHELNNLFSNIERFANEVISPNFGVPNLRIGNFWININGPGDYNIAHDHQNSIFSGTFYVSVPESNMGDLILHRGDNAEFFLTRKIERTNNAYTSMSISKTPKTNKLIIFPSWVKHSVERNESDKERISIAFNLITPNN